MEESRLSDFDVEGSLIKALSALRNNKPAERCEKARRYAVTITEMEKVLSYFTVYVLGNVEEAEDS
ncbi:MAG: hypothetical protein GY743_23640 [Planctomycetaceae bacterium]|nr:hypothetical protein [Planctomycetaceae bacterium]